MRSNTAVASLALLAALTLPSAMAAASPHSPARLGRKPHGPAFQAAASFNHRHAATHRALDRRNAWSTPTDLSDGAAAFGWSAPGRIVGEATRRAQAEPGVTLELAPDAKETATGGPVGGVPGFDGS